MGYKMDYQTFQQEVQTLVEEGLKEAGDYVCVRDTVNKNNITRTGLTIGERGKETAITVYLDQFYPRYLSGEPLSWIGRQVMEVVLKESPPEITLMELKDYGKMKERLRVRLVGREQNEAYLEEGPYKVQPMGAQIVYAELMKTEMGKFGTHVTHSHVKEWGVPEAEIFEAALENSQREEGLRFLSLASEINRLGGLPCPKEETIDKNMLYIVSNQSRDHGAAVLLYPGVLEEIHGKMGGDFYILPSSVHEVMVMSMESNYTPGELRNMVKEVNQTKVDPEERLGNEVYEFRGETGTLQKCRIAEKEMAR